MDGAVDLARRLERFRAFGRPAPAAGRTPGAARPGAAGGEPAGSERSRRLAVGVGGSVLPCGTVEVAAERDLPLLRDRLADLPWELDALRPLVCLDTETTGLGTAAGTLVFLVGLGTWDGDRFRVRQLLLPDHADEPAFLRALAAAIPPGACLVTYNGRSFDWPLLVTRFRLQRSPPPEVPAHLDLLPVARQLWRHRLGDARLATVEAAIAGVRRHGDLPGALIPDRYFAYLRTRDPSGLREVLHHNHQDVVSLALLLAGLARSAADPGRRERLHPGDLRGLARAFARRGRIEDALGCYDAAVARGPLGTWGPAREDFDRLRAERARTLGRLGRREEALGAWSVLADEGGPSAAVAWLQVAKHLEHVRRDYAGALRAATSAQRLCQRRRALGAPTPVLEADLERRLRRLLRLASAVPVEPGAAA